MDRSSFVFYKDWKDAISGLPDDQRLEVYESVIEYATSGKVPMLKPMAGLAFNFIKTTIDRDIEKYMSIAERNRINGKGGGRPPKLNPKEPKKPSGFFGNPEKPKKPDSDSDSVIVNDREPPTPFSQNFNLDFCDDKWKKLLLRWAEWREVNIKRPLIQCQIESAYSMLSGYSFDEASQIIEISISNGWDNLYPEKIVKQIKKTETDGKQYKIL